MGAKLNPLTRVILLATYFVLVLQAESIRQFSWLFITLLTTLLITHVSSRSILFRLGPFLIFFPVMFVLYTVLSLILGDGSVRETVQSVSVATIRILLMICGTALFLELISSTDILDALRTVWRKSGVRWRRVEDAFQLLYLTFRFFPVLKEQVLSMSRLDTALGLPRPGGRIGHMKRMASSLPGLVANCLHRADNLGLAMESRGYGSVLPRGLANPLFFHGADVLALGVLIFFVSGYSALA